MSYLIIVIDCILLFSVVVAKLSLRFNGARDFYHELGEEAMEFLFSRALLNKETVRLFGQLVADNLFNIQRSYGKVCRLMSKDRAEEMLHLVKGHKNLEMYLLGMNCLSREIIGARKNSQMWPPTQFPLLVKGFDSNGIDTKDIQEILNEALNHPEWWQSPSWSENFKFYKTKDLRFWRMTSPGDPVIGSPININSYIWRAALHINDFPEKKDLEELLMKSIRINGFYPQWIYRMEKRGLYGDGLSRKFSHLQDPWSLTVLSVLKLMYTINWNTKNLARILLNSGLVQFATWQGGLIDETTAINDILDLFTAAYSPLSLDMPTEELEEALKSFLDHIVDWSRVRPLVIERFITKSTRLVGYVFIGKYIDKILMNPHALIILDSDLLLYSARLDAQMRRLKEHYGTYPLRYSFALGGPNGYQLSPYTKLLYREWRLDKNNWPGMMIVHEKIKHQVRRVFKDGVGDPRTDQDYEEDTWDVAFDSIKFDAIYNNPSSVILSSCFLFALLYYEEKSVWRLQWNWLELRKRAGKGCVFPSGHTKRARYLSALRWADFRFFDKLPRLPITDVNILQALIYGHVDVEEGIMKRLSSHMSDCTLQ